MLTFTTPITVPNLTRLRVVSVNVNDDHADVVVEVLPPIAGKVYAKVLIVVRDNGTCGKLMVNQSSATYGDIVVVGEFTPTTAAFTNVYAAWKGGATMAASKKAVETCGLTDGWLAIAGTVA